MKRFTLKRMALFLATALMLLSGQSVMAQYFKLTPVNGIYSWGQDGPGSETYQKLVDANIQTKWGCWVNFEASDEDAYPINPNGSVNKMFIIVKAEKAVAPNHYFLVTANDTKDTKRNWASWKIYGGNFDSDENAVREGDGWTLLDIREDEPLPNDNFTPKNFEFSEILSGDATEYQYYWVEIEKTVNESEEYAQMAEWGLGTYQEFVKYQEDYANANTSVDEPIRYKIIAGDRIDNSGESLTKLFDGDINTKWGNGFTQKTYGETKNGAYFIVRASREIAPTYYKLVTGTDNASWNGRNWKNWQIYGLNEEDYDDTDTLRNDTLRKEAGKWVLLDKKLDVSEEVLPDKNRFTVIFNLSEENTTKYRVFKVEIDATMGAGYMQMGEFSLGDEYTVGFDKAPIVETAEEDFDPTVFAEKALLDRRASLIEQINACDDIFTLGSLYADVVDVKEKIQTSIRNYSELINVRSQALQLIAEENLVDNAMTYITGWVSEDNAIAPNEEYPCGNYAYIVANRQITGTAAVEESNRISNYLFNNTATIPDPITATYTFIRGTTDNWNDKEGPDMLIDGKSGLNGTESTKWGTGTGGDRFVIFRADQPIQPTYYGLVTGGDTNTYKERNWKNWKIWGANFNSDEEAKKDTDAWVLLDNKQNVGTEVLKTTNCFESYIYLSEGCREPYKYFKIEVYHNGGMQMNEFTFYNTGNFMKYRDGFVQEFATYDPDKTAYIGYINDFKQKYEDLQNVIKASDLLPLRDNLKEIQNQIANSEKLYHDYDSIFNVVSGLNIEAENLGAWQEGYASENIAPCAKYMRGTHEYIMENGSLNDDSIKIEMDYLNVIINAVEKDLYILLGGHTVGQWGDGFYGNLIDGIATKYIDKEGKEQKGTKWGGQADANGDTYIIFRTQDPTNPFFYTLTTGNDSNVYTGRNWGTWYIYGANFEGDGDATKDAEGWVLVDAKENVGQDRLHPLAEQPSYFGFSTETTVPYTYYKLVVTKAYEGNAIQMNELHFGTTDEFEKIKNNYQTLADNFDTDVVAQQDLLDQYEDVASKIEDCMNMEALFRANNDLENLQAAITASAKAYTDFSTLVDEISMYLDDNPLDESETLATLKSYLDLDNEVEPGETFINGSAAYILDKHVLADSIVAGEIAYLDSLKKEAIVAGYVAGTDITSMIVNRSFAKAEQALDEKGKAISGTKIAEGWDGYIYANGTNAEGTMSAAEFCNAQSKFNISQTLTNMKNGYYQVKLNAGFRPHNDINSFDHAALAFANDTKTFIPVVREDMVASKDEAWTGNIADKEIYAVDLLSPEDEPSGNPEVDSVVVGYVIWGVQGTINAILHDRYEINLIAQVTDGNLTFGMKNEGTIIGGDWLGAGNFRLTYLGEEAPEDAIAEAATYNAERAATLLEVYYPGDALQKDDFIKAPNFSAAQKEALATLGESATVEQLVADGNLFAEIYATKNAYYKLCFFADAVYEKWLEHDVDFSNPLDVSDYVENIQDGLIEGTYENAAAADAATDELLAKYPDYLEVLSTSTNYVTSVDEFEPFTYEIATEDANRLINITFGTMYDDLTKDETVLQFEYTADIDIDNVSIQNTETTIETSVGKLESSSDFKKVSVDVKSLGLKKKGDKVNLRFKANGATVVIRNVMFVKEAGVKGDLNNDKKVNSGDIQTLLNIIADGTYKAEADLNDDSKVNSGDIQTLLNIIAQQ